MSQRFQFEDGNTWEADVKRWLRLRYPNDFQSIPASDGGDAGIEGFCHVDANVYQCYAPQTGYDTKTAYEHQRAKLTEDIGKFIANTKKLKQILPKGFKIRRYNFVISDFRSKSIVAHATTKTEEVKNANLDYVADDFAIMVQDRDDYEAERRIEEQRLIVRLNVQTDPVAQDDIESWEADNNNGVKNLDRKIPLFTKLVEPEHIESHRRYWIERKICTDNAFEKLRLQSAEAWERLWKAKHGREQLLGRAFGIPDPSNGTVKSISDDLASDMISRVPNLEKLGADTLAEGIVGEWLQNCKLDFPTPIIREKPKL